MHNHMFTSIHGAEGHALCRGGQRIWLGDRLGGATAVTAATAQQHCCEQLQPCMQHVLVLICKDIKNE